MDRDAEFHFSNVGAGLSVTAGVCIVFAGFAALAIAHGQQGKLLLIAAVIPLLLIFLRLIGRSQVDERGVTWTPLWGRRVRIDWHDVTHIRWSANIFAISDGQRTIQVSWMDTPASNRGPAEWLVRYALRDFDLKRPPAPPMSIRRMLILLLPSLGVIMFSYAWLVRSLPSPKAGNSILPALVFLLTMVYPLIVFAVEAFTQRHSRISPSRWRTRTA